jgi:hypothetical protein
VANLSSGSPGKPSKAPPVRPLEDDWWGTADADITQLVAWDIDGELLREALLSALATGRALGFYPADSGRAISVYLYEGKERRKRRCYDADELTDLLQRIRRRFIAEAQERRRSAPTDHLQRIDELRRSGGD